MDTELKSVASHGQNTYEVWKERAVVRLTATVACALPMYHVV
jgi:hypothetical protein